MMVSLSIAGVGPGGACSVVVWRRFFSECVDVQDPVELECFYVFIRVSSKSAILSFFHSPF